MIHMRIATTFSFIVKTTIDVWSAANVWHLIAVSLVILITCQPSFFNLLQQMSSSTTIMWSIWKAHNRKVWQHVSGTTILERAKHVLEGWMSANRT